MTLAQWETDPKDPDANAAKADDLLRHLRDTDVVVFPELWLTGYGPLRRTPADWPDAGAALEAVARLACAGRMNVVAGSVAETLAGRPGNVAHVFDRAGQRVALYRKVHLFRPLEEDALFSPGDRLCTFRLDGVPCGLLVCYDLRFPEMARALALRGARVLFVPARWPGVRIDHWRALLIARAIENQCFVVGANAAGRDAQAPGGHSLAVDPWGRVVAEGGAGEETVVASIDLEQVEAVRSSLPVFADRLPDLYAAWADGAGT